MKPVRERIATTTHEAARRAVGRVVTGDVYRHVDAAMWADSVLGVKPDSIKPGQGVWLLIQHHGWVWVRDWSYIRDRVKAQIRDPV